MELDPKVLSALIASIVSLSIALASFVANRKALAVEREKLEKQLQRQFTEKLYDLRLEHYPKAMEITEGLRKSKVKEQGDNISEKYFKRILDELDSWYSTKAGFLLSSTATNRLYDIRELLRAKPALNSQYSKEQLLQINQAKGRFRKALRSDIALIYQEEIGHWEVPTPLSKRT